MEAARPSCNPGFPPHSVAFAHSAAAVCLRHPPSGGLGKLSPGFTHFSSSPAQLLPHHLNSRPSPVSLDSTHANRRRRIFRRHKVAAQWTRLVTAAWFRYCRSVCCHLCPTNSSSSFFLSQSGPRATVRRRRRTVFSSVRLVTTCLHAVARALGEDS